MVDFPDKEAHMTWFCALYGSTMAAVQGVEQAISFLYVVANVDPERQSNASPQRQWRDAVKAAWTAFQQGSSGMRLNDAVRGLKQYLDPSLFDKVDAFIRGPRNQLAHRFLIERIAIVERDGLPALSSAVLELIGVVQSAQRLLMSLMERATEIRAAWPVASDPPPEIQEAIDTLMRMTLLKEFPEDLVKNRSSA